MNPVELDQKRRYEYAWFLIYIKVDRMKKYNRVSACVSGYIHIYIS